MPRPLAQLLLCVALIAAYAPAATAAQGETQLRAPKEGVAFDGKSAFAAEVSALKLTPKAVTVSAWVRPANVSGSQVFVNVGRVNSGFTLYLFDGKVRMLVGHKTPAYAHAAAPAPDAGKWTHYAGTYDGKSIRVYRNGQQAAETPAPGQMELEGKLFIGSANEHERFFEGEMEDVRVWRRALTPGEIAAITQGKAGTITEGLAGGWTRAGLAGKAWKAEPESAAVAARFDLAEPEVLINSRDEGYRGIWYMNQPSNDEYVYKYSGGMGTYPANHIPFAWYASKVNKTFFTYGGTTTDSNQRLIHMVSYYDHATGTVPRPTILLDKKTGDAHDNPVINLDDEGYIWIFSSSHGRGRPSYISRSTKPYSVDEFKLVWTGNFSYPQPWHIPGHGFLFMHTYYNPGRTVCMMTSRDGAEWTERRLLSSIGEGHYQVSRPCVNKVGTSFMYHPKGKGLNWRTNLYYMESHDFGATWKNAAGKPLTIPLTEIENPALVQEYESKGLLVYIQDINYDAEGRPVILYTTSKGYESGPKNMPRTWTTARWTGKAWEIHGGDIISDNNYDTGSVYLEKENLWRIIGPTEVGPQAFNPGGEIALWTSSDHGENWKKVRQMTAGSPRNHTYVRRPVNAHPDFYGFWADGHGRQPSDSRLYFCNQAGDVFRLPVKMSKDTEKPEQVSPAAAATAR